ncbi:MAG: MEDS domain-containing protein, partial [Thermoplasmata archaeon]|nr:MEDS domain-containing protein [Thermoplasmata archaeon]
MRKNDGEGEIDILSEIPWGTHICLFYESRDDLVDILVPYFKNGLENNEICMWITSNPLSEKEAGDALSAAVPHIDRYTKKGQLEFLPYAEWYSKGDSFDKQKVLDRWAKRLDKALSGGYDGIRVAGNTSWLKNED